MTRSAQHLKSALAAVRRVRPGPSAQRIAGWALLLTLPAWVWGCGTDGNAGNAGPTPTPTVSATPTACAAELGSDASERVRQGLIAVRLALTDGLSLTESLEAVFAVTISAMTTVDRADSLRVLAALDSCPRESVGVRDEIPTLIHRLAEESTRLPR